MQPLVPLSEFALDPARVYFNHGGYGAPPRAVLDARARWQAEVEADPTSFFLHRWRNASVAVLDRVSALLAAPGLLPVANATTGTATALASVDWAPGDEVVVTDHGYPAVSAQLAALARRGVRAVAVAAQPLAGLPGRVAGAVTPRTRLVVLDHITSPSALVLPVAEVAAALAGAGVPLVVDAAHVPVHLDVDVAGSGAAVWTGNLHKWAGAVRATAVLWRAPGAALEPLVRSSREPAEDVVSFGWWGTHDPSAWLSVPDGLDWVESLGGPDVLRAHGSAVLDLADEGLAPLLDGARHDPAAAPCMRAWPLPRPLEAAQRAAVEAALSAEGITTYLPHVAGTTYLRLCAYAYTGSDDVSRLLDALPSALRAAG